jgi:hypothetical protein
MSDADDGGLSRGMTVRDDDEHSTHKRRKRLIEDLREEAISIRMDAHGQRVNGSISREQARQHYRGAVSTYLREVFQVIAAEGVDLSKNYENEVTLGEIVFEPPPELVTWARDNVRNLLPGEQVPSPKPLPIVGLRQVTDLPSPLSYTFSVDYRSGGQIQTKTRTVTAELPQRVLDEAIEQADAALSEAGVGLEIDEGERVVKIDRDLLEEVDAWRQNNL